MKLSLFFLAVASITGVSARTDYACCSEPCDFAGYGQMCLNNPLEQPCGMYGPNSFQDHPNLCMKVSAVLCWWWCLMYTNVPIWN